MTPRAGLFTLVLILVTLVTAAAVERAVPLFAPPRGVNSHRRVTNLGMTGLTFVMNLALLALTAAVAAVVPWASPAMMERAGLSMPAQFVLGIAALDFAWGYIAHRTMHASATLWRVHRVHHADPFVDVTTSFRTHPIEHAWRHLWMIATIGLLGVPASALVVYRLLSAVNAVLEHANVRVARGVDTALSAIVVTPNMHKVHHSRDPRETNTNYGNVLSIFDRVLGTFTPTERASSVTYGLDDAPPEACSTLTELLAVPFRSEGASKTAAVHAR